MIDRTLLRLLREEIDAALKPIGEKFKLAISWEKASFSPQNATIKLQASVLNEEGIAETQTRSDFKKYAIMFGLKPEWLDKSFSDFSGHVYVISGLSMRSRKAPVIGESRGKEWKLPIAMVIHGMAQEEKEQQAHSHSLGKIIP